VRTARRSIRWIAAFALVGVATFPLAGSAHPAFAGSGPPPVQVMTGSAGQYLSDVNGMTLYTFSADQANSGSSACADACATAWPAVMLMFGGVAIPPPGLMGTLATITRSGGSQQVTYNGMPLYRFVRDSSSGQMNGQGVTAFGGTWAVATP
jgi:predicted lipoprotein with Yx(FWY)xxD motif